MRNNRSSQSSTRHRRRLRRGAETVELAVAAPVLLILVMGVIEYAQLVNAAQTVGNASRRGARVAARNSTASTVDVENYVNSLLTASFPNLASGVQVTVRDVAGNVIAGSGLASVGSGTQFSVEVSLSFDAVRWLGVFSGLSNQMLRTTTAVRRQ